MAKGKKKVPRKGTQEHLPEMAPERNKRIYAAAVKYRNIMRERVILTNKETEAKATLLDIMHDEGVKHYGPDGDIEVYLSPGEDKLKLVDAAEEKKKKKAKDEATPETKEEPIELD